jgi:hypothetical protein
MLIKNELVRQYSNNGVQKSIIVSTHPERIRNKPAIRYGNSEREFENDTTLNSREFIQLVSNKKSFADLISESGFYTPTFQHIGEGAGEFPIMIRETLSSFGGRGCHVVSSNEELRQYRANRNWWWTPYVHTTYECRAHVLDGQVVRVFRKEYNGEGAEAEFPIRNSANGYHFSLRSVDANPAIVDLVRELHPLLPPNGFYALDLGWIHDENRYFIFEANSAPGLNENTARLYAEFLYNKLTNNPNINDVVREMIQWED